jgi:hypothetical protein
MARIVRQEMGGALWLFSMTCTDSLQNFARSLDNRGLLFDNSPDLHARLIRSISKSEEAKEDHGRA